jgi:hypothetical protein
MDHPLPWLRYLNASDLDDETIEFDGLKVRNAEMETLGKVEGFIVDSQSARPYYVVVDAGGWFKSKHYLMPVGLAQIDDDNDALVVNLSKERIARFPGFDKDKFETMSDADLKRFNDETCNATGDSTVTYAATESYSSAWERPQYAMPSWWSVEPEFPDRMGETAFTTGAEYPPSKVAPTTTGSTVGGRYDAERVTAQAKDTAKVSTDAAARKGEDSPFFDGRAQPGDVIGLDTGGERTYVGDTAEDENKRREAAEEAARKDRS